MTDIDLNRLAVDREYWDECGAPDGATHYGPHAQRFIKECKSCYMAFLPEYRSGEWVAIESPMSHQYIPRPTNQEWDGEGLPPVGVECEVRAQDGEPWYVVEIIAHYQGSAVFVAGDDYPYGVYDGCSHPENFRPLKTQHERQRNGDSVAVPVAALEYLKDQWPGAYAKFYERIYSDRHPKPLQ